MATCVLSLAGSRLPHGGQLGITSLFYCVYPLLYGYILIITGHARCCPVYIDCILTLAYNGAKTVGVNLHER